MSTSPMHEIPGAFEKLNSLYFKGNELMTEGKYEEAAEIYTEGINIDDNFRHMYVTQYAMRAVCYFQTQKYKEAVHDYEKALEKESNVNNRHADYHFTLGMCYNALKEWDKALINLNKAIEANPQDFEAVLNRSSTYIGLSRLDKALVDYELAIAHTDEKDQQVISARDELRKELGLAAYNEEVKVFTLKGNDLLNENNYSGAIEAFTQALAIDDNFRYNHVSNYAMRGHCYMVLEKFPEAIADFERALELDPNFRNSHADYYARIGKCYGHGLNDIENAIINYNKSIELNPINYEAIFFRGYCYMHLEKLQEALADFELVIEHVENLDEQTYKLRDTLREQLGLKPVTKDDDLELFPGEAISKLSDYVNFMKKVQSGDMNEALLDYGLTMTQYSELAQKWGKKLASDQNLTVKYTELITN